MKKILFVHQTSMIGGASYCLLSLLKEINREKYLPVVLLQSDGPLVEEIRKLDISVFFLPELCIAPYNLSFKSPLTLHYYLKLSKPRRMFYKVLDKINPDLVYLNNSMLYPYLKIAKQYGCKTLIHIREHWPLNEHKVQLGWLQKQIVKYSDYILAINKYSSEMVPNVSHKTSIVYDWIEFKGRSKTFDMDQIFHEDTSDKKIFLYTGGMQNIKGLFQVISSFNQLKGTDKRLLALGVDINYHYNGIKGKIKSLLRYLGLKDPIMDALEIIKKDSRIVTVPFTYEIKEIIEQSYCVLSFFTIPHANLALAESIYLKTPIIAASTPESMEYSDNGKYAVLFKFGDYNEFTKKLNSLDLHYATVKQKAINGSFYIADMFDRKKNANLFRNVLDNILN